MSPTLLIASLLLPQTSSVITVRPDYDELLCVVSMGETAVVGTLSVGIDVYTSSICEWLVHLMFKQLCTTNGKLLC